MSFMKMNAFERLQCILHMRESCPLCLLGVGSCHEDSTSSYGGCGHAADEASFEEEADDQGGGAGARRCRTDFFAGRKRGGVRGPDRRASTTAELRTRPIQRAERGRTRRRQPCHL